MDDLFNLYDMYCSYSTGTYGLCITLCNRRYYSRRSLNLMELHLELHRRFNISRTWIDPDDYLDGHEAMRVDCPSAKIGYKILEAFIDGTEKKKQTVKFDKRYSEEKLQKYISDHKDLMEEYKAEFISGRLDFDIE